MSSGSGASYAVVAAGSAPSLRFLRVGPRLTVPLRCGAKTPGVQMIEGDPRVSPPVAANSVHPFPALALMAFLPTGTSREPRTSQPHGPQVVGEERAHDDQERRADPRSHRGPSSLAEHDLAWGSPLRLIRACSPSWCRGCSGTAAGRAYRRGTAGSRRRDRYQATWLRRFRVGAVMRRCKNCGCSLPARAFDCQPRSRPRAKPAGR
jgi:hypothetical protein